MAVSVVGKQHPDANMVWPRALLLFALLFAIIGGAATTVLYSQARAARLVAETNERNRVGHQAGIIVSDFAAVLSDLRVLADGLAMRNFLESGSTEDRTRLADEMLGFSSSKQCYDQVRLLDERGQEVVRVNLIEGRPKLVADEALQSKAGRYYFDETIKLEPEQVFVSPLDLNVENERIEQPPKPTIRFCTPVVDRAGKKRGIAVLNYLGATLLSSLERAAAVSGGQTMLVNPDGYWLHGGGAENDWAFMYPERRERTFAKAYPDAWRRIQAESEGQTLIADGLFTFRNVHPLATPGLAIRAQQRDAVRTVSLRAGYTWAIITYIPRDNLPGGLRQLTASFAPLYGVLAAALAALSWLVARHNADRQVGAARLREQEERFRQLADNVDEVFWMVDVASGALLYVSPAFERIWGMRCDDVRLGSGEWPPQVNPEHRERVRALVPCAVERGECAADYNIVRPDGGLRAIRDRAFAVRDAQGRAYRVAGLADDVTQLREAQQRELQTQRLAAIGEAMTGLAHESRNALQRSQAGLEMLGRRIKDCPESQAILAEIEQAQRHLHRLYEEVRGYAAPIRPERSWCDFHELVEQTWRQVTVARADCADRLSTSGTESLTRCWIDRFAFSQVVRNILENSLAAANPAEVTIDYEAVEWNGRPSLRIRFRDNGPGLDEEQRARIFEPFYSTRSRGTGLGMAIARRIVEAHGGTIEAGGAAGGAEIIITLPRGSDD